LTVFDKLNGTFGGSFFQCISVLFHNLVFMALTSIENFTRKNLSNRSKPYH
jgi:hypothetical protein